MQKNHYDPILANYKKQSLSFHGGIPCGESEKNSYKNSNELEISH